MTTHRGFGRIPSKPHPRMAAFGAEQVLPEGPARSYTWACELWLNQQDTPRCVGFSGAHEVAARPIERAADVRLAGHFYAYAQDHDYWPGTDYEGTSVDGGMQAMREYGYIESWYWARTVPDVLRAISRRGPVVFGLDWMTGMGWPDARGFIHPTGSVEGGHAILGRQVGLRYKPGTTTAQKRSAQWFDHVDLDASWIGLHNSWGPGWQPQVNGRPVPVKITVREFTTLFAAGGECAVPVGRLR